jgi:hypothetical protein
MLECPACGHQNPDDRLICEACGQPIDPQPAAHVPAVEPAFVHLAGTPQNSPAKKKQRWGWIAYGCGLAILAVLVLVVGAMDLAKWIPRIGHVTVNSTSSTTISSLPFTFTSVSSADSLNPPSLFDGMSQALNLNNDTDFQAPKQYTGAIGLNKGVGFSLGNGWCAKDQATLKNNLANISYSFSINGTAIDLNKYPTLFFTDNRGEACAVSGLNITPNANAQGSYQIKVTQHFAKTLEDGISAAPYPAGDVTFDFTLRFQLPSAPGLNG